jgi:hypothetical protein
MPYITTEEVKEKRKAIRAALPEYKLSVRCRNYSTVDVTIVEGPGPMPSWEGRDGYMQVNPFHLESNHEGEALRVLSIINDIARSGMSKGFHDSDYGYVPGHYVDISIGDWDRPYINKAAA